MPKRVLVSGTGLIGTSIALALRDKGTEVFLSDADPATAKLAADLGAGTVVPELRDAKGIADIAVLAMPRVVRLMAHVETDRTRAQIQHVYLRGAAALRLDIAQ